MTSLQPFKGSNLYSPSPRCNGVTAGTFWTPLCGTFPAGYYSVLQDSYSFPHLSLIVLLVYPSLSIPLWFVSPLLPFPLIICQVLLPLLLFLPLLFALSFAPHCVPFVSWPCTWHFYHLWCWASAFPPPVVPLSVLIYLIIIYCTTLPFSLLPLCLCTCFPTSHYRTSKNFSLVEHFPSKQHW